MIQFGTLVLDKQNHIKKPNIILFLILFAVAAICIFLINPFHATQDDSSSRNELNPVYAEYNFTQPENVIRLGIQPLYSPTGIIFEVVKHDRILQTALAKSGMMIEYYPFYKGSDINHFIGLNLLDAGVGGDMPAISAASNMAIEIPMMVQKGFDSIITKKMMIASYLRGKRIGYPFGSISHYTLLNTLDSFGISEDEVELISMEINELSDALYNNQIDAFCAWEPAATEALKLHPEFFRNFQSPTSGFLYFKSGFSGKFPEETKQILTALVRAISWLNSSHDNLMIASEWNIESSESLTGMKCVLSVKELADLALQDILQLSNIPSINPEDLGPNSKLFEEFKFLLKLNKIPPETEWEKVRNSFNNELFKDVIANINQYMINKYDYALD